MFMEKNADSRGTLNTKGFKHNVSFCSALTSLTKKLMKLFTVHLSFFLLNNVWLVYFTKLGYMFWECEYCSD